ncbi:hypothetical protein [Pseudooceanicola nanhaiensis]|uniref:hypothetical protein n=1 Tax=Pseudooceanicola nanhaiensis TaxID=375761 RepID=UPI004057D044
MKSRNRRLRRALLSFSVLPLILRLVFVAAFILLFAQGSIYLRGISTDNQISIQPDGSIDLSLPLSGFIQGRLFVISILSTVALGSMLLGINVIYKEHRKRRSVSISSVRSYLDANRFKRKKIILMLRPFELDGFLILLERRSFWRYVFFPIINTSTVEQVFERQARKYFDADVISIADPYKDELVPGPIYLSTGEDWRADVQRLVDVAKGIVFVIPQIADMTTGLAWEIETLYRRSASDFAAAVFPPRRGKTPVVCEVIQEFIDRSGFEFASNIALKDVFFLDLGSTGQVWYEQRRSWLPWPQRTYSDVYSRAAADWLSRRLS